MTTVTMPIKRNSDDERVLAMKQDRSSRMAQQKRHEVCMAVVKDAKHMAVAMKQDSRGGTNWKGMR